MDSTERLILQYLHNILPVHPKIPFNEPNERPRGLFAEFRLEGFKDATKVVNIRPLVESFWTEISCKVYRINNGHHYLWLIIALYDEGIVLWLDNEADDRDFALFARREKLWSWLGASVDNFIELLLQSKLSYLGQPRLLRDVADIPLFPEDMWNWQLPTDNDVQRENRRKAHDAHEERLRHVTPLIQPPAIIQNSDGAFDLRFCIWTKVLGRVYDIHCSLGPSRPFTYKGFLLAEWVGKGFAPR